MAIKSINMGKNFTKTLSLLLAATATFTMTAKQESGRNLMYGSIVETQQQVMAGEMANVSTPEQVMPMGARRHSLKANEIQCKVTLMLKCNSAEYQPSLGVVIGDNYADQDFPMSGKVTLYVAPGTYDFIGTYIRKNNIGGGLSRVVREKVTVDGDTEIELDAAEATKRVQFSTYLPSGERAKLNVLENNVNGPGATVKEKGNVAFMYISTFLYNTKYRMSILYGGSCKSSTLGGYAGEASYDFYINDISDDYSFYQMRQVDDGIENVYTNVLGSKGLTTDEVKNDYTKYHSYLDTFAFTPARDKYDRTDYQSQIYNMFLVNNEPFISSFSNLQNSDVTIHFCESAVPSGSADMKVMIAPCSDDIVQCVEDAWSKNYFFNGTLGTYVTWNGTDFEHINANHSIYGNTAFQTLEDPNAANLVYPGHKGFYYTHSQKGGKYANNAPINVVMDQTFYNDYYEMNTTTMDCCYIGRYGEVRTVDYIGLGTEVKSNGEKVCDTYADFVDTWPYEFADAKREFGVLDIKFENLNVKVDDIEGKNITYVHADKTKTDGTAPTLQMLQMKNNDGILTDRFETAEDGTIEFAGGDFKYILNPETWYSYFSCNPMTIKVEYAPYNTENYSELNVSEVPELFTMPNFGYFYRGSLKDVKGTSSNGWFDLRFTLTDESNNYQIQTISPAFRIADRDAGVSAVEVDNSIIITPMKGEICINGIDNPLVEIYNLSGVKVISKIGNRIDTSSLTHGIYAVRVAGTNATCKLAI